MSSVNGVVFSVAMAAVCGAVVIHLALKLQKSLSSPPPSPETQFDAENTPPLSPPRPCLSSGEKKEKKRKKVRFAKDVAEPSGNSEEFRNRHKSAGSTAVVATVARGGMPANRVALYNGILRDRGIHRLAYSH